MTTNSQINKETFIKVALLFLMFGSVLKVLAVVVGGVHLDTNFYLSIGQNFIDRGELTPYMWRLGADTNIIAGSGTGYGILILNYWFKLFGLTLLSGYILMYIAGALSLIVLFFLVRNWWNSDIAGLIAVTFTSLTGYFLSTYYIRMDALAILTYTSLLLLHIYAVQHQKRWIHALVGVAVIASAEIHILATLYVVSLSFYYGVEQLKHWWKRDSIFAITPSIAFFSGAFVAGIAYLFIHVIPDPEAYFIIARECPNCLPAGLAKEIRRYTLVMNQYSVEMLIFGIVLLVSYLRRSDEDKHLFTLLIGYLIAQAIISPPPQLEYFVHILPLLGLYIGGIFIKKDASEPILSRFDFKVITLVAVYLTISYFVIIMSSFGEVDEDVPELEYVQQYIADDTVIMSVPDYYYLLLDYTNFLSYASGEEYGIALRDESYGEFYQREQPQVIIGQPELDDEAIWRYMNVHEFERVTDDIWVSGSLLDELTANVPAPDITFAASDAIINIGECVLIEWQIDNADTIILNDSSVESSGSEEVCPLQTKVYEIDVLWAGGLITQQVTIEIE